MANETASFDMGVAPMYWRGAVKCPCTTGRVATANVSNSRGIGLLCVVGKLYGRVLIKRVRAGTECAIREEQCVVKQGRDE